jgi:hypothetical protein
MGRGVGDLRLYGLDDAGEAVFAEDLASGERGGLRALAERRLADWHAVEVWDGPLCVVRLSRRRAD